MSKICNHNGRKPSKNAKTPPEDCRLRTELNEDCIINLLQLLSGNDLMSMCEVDDYFENLIKEWIIGKRLIKLNRMSNCCKVEILETFGRSIRELVASEDELENFVETIVKYYAPGRLTKIELEFRNSKLDANIINLSMPFFSNLIQLSLNGSYCEWNDSFDNFLTEVALNASNLQSLHLSCIDVKGNWLNTKEMRNLCELRISEPKYVSFVDLNIFLKNHSKLTKFSFIASTSIIRIKDNGFNLETFADVHLDTFFNPPSQTETDIMNRFMFLSTFSNLKNLILTSYTSCGFDLYYPLVQLAGLNVTYLELVCNSRFANNFNQSNRERIMQRPVPKCNSLKELQITGFQLPWTGGTHLQNGFILHFVTHLKNLQKLTFNQAILKDVGEILKFFPHIRMFAISTCSLKHLPVQMRKIVRLLRIRHNDHSSYQNLLRLIVDETMWRELNVYKDIDDIVARTIKYATPQLG